MPNGNGLRGLITPLLTIEGSLAQFVQPLVAPLNIAPPVGPLALIDQSFGGILANLPTLPGLNNGGPLAAAASVVQAATPREITSRVGGASNRIVSQVRRGV